jgi:hypothetical protein
MRIDNAVGRDSRQLRGEQIGNRIDPEQSLVEAVQMNEEVGAAVFPGDEFFAFEKPPVK